MQGPLIRFLYPLFSFHIKNVFEKSEPETRQYFIEAEADPITNEHSLPRLHLRLQNITNSGLSIKKYS